MEFRILGPLEVVEQGRALPLGGARQRTVLALLLTRANEVVSADRLIDELWGTQPPRSAANALQYHVSQLRKALAPHTAIVTQEPGYVIRVGPDELDLLRFELLVEEAQQAAPEVAARKLREALALWRGPPLADVAHESFAQMEVLRLEELHMGALEQRVDADLALGHYAELVGEVQVLVREHPLRERLRAALMQALYGSGRQVEALEVYRETRRLLVDELGIEPSPALQELEQAILRHDPALTSLESPPKPRQRSIMLVATDPRRLDDLLAIAKPLARRPIRELILTRLLRDDGELASASATLAEHRDALAQEGVPSRTAVFTTGEPGTDAVRLATEHDVDLVLLDAAPGLLESGWPDPDLAAVLERAPCDAAVLVGGGELATGPVVTPFGGVEHDWSAVEVAAWLAQSLGTTLRLLGTEANPALGRRDASRLLSRASMLVQQVVGIVTEPFLIRPGEEGVLEAARDARLLVVGLSDRWQTEGIGRARLAVALGLDVPTLFVRRGLRPSGVAPSETLTRFTWTLGPGRILPPEA
ncbi:MAG: AfsR/SARP family transcriptional regulator [Actinomycetota bacterium]|nr:AfsR/SARP family transcriptional regulator [Actinomycetota bacterium]